MMAACIAWGRPAVRPRLSAPDVAGLEGKVHWYVRRRVARLGWNTADAADLHLRAGRPDPCQPVDARYDAAYGAPDPHL